MENLEKIFKKTTKFCMPLMNECIRNEINEYLNGYEIVDIKRTEKIGFYDCELENSDGNNISMHIGIDQLRILKKSEHYLDKIVINNDEKWYQRTLEKRKKGFVVTDITKEYGVSKRFNNNNVLVDLTEERYILSNKNMKEMLSIEDIENQTLVHLYLTMFNKNIKFFSDLTTKFSTHINYYYFTPFEGHAIKDNIYPTRTYFNEEEISHTYDLVDGPDKLYRVYDLYKGIINKKNEYDIKSIHLGLLTKRSFDLKTLEGITQHENYLVGESLIPVSNEYKNYLKEFFSNFNGYKDEIKLDRKSMLTAIDYVMSIREYAQKHIEEDVGIPYDEYERMEFDEQLKVNSLSYKLIRKTKNFFKNFKK